MTTITKTTGKEMMRDLSAQRSLLSSSNVLSTNLWSFEMQVIGSQTDRENQEGSRENVAKL